MARLFGEECSTEEFIHAFGERALQRYPKSLILPSLIICQALVESSGPVSDGQWLPGCSTIAMACWNYHGLNFYNDSVTKGYAHETFITYQERDGVLVESVEQFCKFSDIEEELNCLYAWYGRRATEQQRLYYGALTGCTNAYENFVNIRLAGFATSSSYTTQLQNTYERYPSIAEFDAKALETQNPSSICYFVQVGAFRNKYYAEHYMKLVKSRGFPAIIKEQDGYYKVQTGAFQIRAYAEAQVEALKNVGIEAFIYEGEIELQ
jgi:hypothetical protein